MEKLIHLPNYPKIEFITSTLLLQQEVRIYFHDFENSSYELHFPHIYDFKYSVQAVFFPRRFVLGENHDNDKSIFLVENSDYIRKFIHDTDGSYGEEGFYHYLIAEYIDAMMELISTEPPVLRCLERKFNTGK